MRLTRCVISMVGMPSRTVLLVIAAVVLIGVAGVLTFLYLQPPAPPVDIQSPSMPSTVRVNENGTFKVTLKNSGADEHTVTIYFNASRAKVSFYLGNNALSHNSTHWWYSKTLDPGDEIRVSIILKGSLETGEFSSTIRVGTMFFVDNKLYSQFTKIYEVTISAS